MEVHPTSGTTIHSTKFLQQRFPGMVFSRKGENWPPRSYEMTPLEFLSSDFLKSQSYANYTQSFDALKINMLKVTKYLTIGSVGFMLLLGAAVGI